LPTAAAAAAAHSSKTRLYQSPQRMQGPQQIVAVAIKLSVL